MTYSLKTIGRTFADETGFGIKLESEYKKAMEGLEGFSHIQVIWWFSECDDEESRNKLIEKKPYKKAPALLGVFATRSPERPNPIAVSASFVTSIERKNGIIRLAWLDAFDGTPVLDIKPYTPSTDRVESPEVPEWCRHWPKNIEASADFSWEEEFNF